MDYVLPRRRDYIDGRREIRLSLGLGVVREELLEGSAEVCREGLEESWDLRGFWFLGLGSMAMAWAWATARPMATASVMVTSTPPVRRASRTTEGAETSPGGISVPVPVSWVGEGETRAESHPIRMEAASTSSVTTAPVVT